MDYDQAQLLVLTKELTDKYTLKYSSSVTYETAQMLMGAVIYTINQAVDGNELVHTSGVDLGKLYRTGIERMKSLYLETVELHQDLMKDFEDYGVDNYSDTVVKGISAFFIHYDMSYKPQDHILTLDYPLLKDYSYLTGISRINMFVKGVVLENRFLNLFEPQDVKGIISRVSLSDTSDYMDNICEPVILNAIACMWVNQRLGSVRLTKENVDILESLLQGVSLEQIEIKVIETIRSLIKAMSLEEEIDYFLARADSYAYRLYMAGQNSSLGGMFGLVSPIV